MSGKDRLSDWLQAEWYGATSSPKAWLLPLESLFKRAVDVRRRAYRAGHRPAERLPVPVIVVGNLSLGGTGKTPLTIWLAEFLRQHGYRPGIVSRGYGGKGGAEPLAVTPDSDPAATGDEPVLIARRTGCPVCVFPQRAQAGRALLARGGCDILIADDGLQHYALARDIEIAVVDGARGLGNGHCLPAGPLREPPERLDTVDLVVYSGVETAERGYPMVLDGTVAVNLRDGSRRPLAGFAGQKVCAMAGIGHPQRFFDHLRGLGLDCEGRAFPDHYAYQPGDLAFAQGAELLMTEKDAVKCRPFAAANHWQVPVTARLPEAFGQDLLTLLENKRDGWKTA